MTEPSETSRQPAIVLIGPTGAGKTPLGAMMERRGLWSKRCVHFDFGEHLRRIVARDQPDRWLAAHDIAFLRDVLKRGVLLEDEHFPLAERIVQAFLAGRGVDRQTHLVLNGLPRHVGQARAMTPIMGVQVVIHLCCSTDVVLRRVESNVGADRTGRVDDDPGAVARKLAIFEQRTAPLLEHYRRHAARIETLDVTADMTTEQIWTELNCRR